MPRKLIPADFRRVDLGVSFYLSHVLPNGHELCLEPCLNGFDVALYGVQENLIAPKRCTDLPSPNNPADAFSHALALANELLATWEDV